MKKFFKLFIFAELMMIVCIVSFFAGKRLSAKEYQKQMTTIVNELQERYETEKQKDNDHLSADGKAESNSDTEKNNNSTETHTVDPLLILVNKNNPLPESYEVSLKTLPDGVNKAAKDAYQPLCDMLNAGRKEGLAFEICSSYRSVERQKELFYEDLEALIRRGFSYEKAYKEVASETMPPGHSEHSTGLAFDIVSLNYQMLDANQTNTPESQWLQKHCAEYGFILRYPVGKEDITHINFESWHYRYVGIEIASYIMENELTLEEYLEAFPGGHLPAQ